MKPATRFVPRITAVELGLIASLVAIIAIELFSVFA